MKFYEKTETTTDHGNRVLSVRWDWNSKGKTTGSTVAQNLSTTL